MRRFSLLIVAMSLLGFLAMPASARHLRFLAAKHEKTITGTVKSIDSQTLTLSVENKKGKKSKEHKINVNASTNVTIDGKPGTPAAVTPGATVTVTLSHHTATQIDVKTNTSTSNI